MRFLPVLALLIFPFQSWAHPVLFSETASTRAISMEAVTFKPQPSRIVSSFRYPSENTGRTDSFEIGSDPLSPLVNIVVDGDSLAFGSKASTPGKSFPNQMTALLGKRYPITNIAVAGQGASDMLRDEAAQLYPLVNPKAKKNVVVIWGLTNEAVVSGITAQQCVDHVLTYVENATSHGFNKAIVLTMVNLKGFTGNYTEEGLEAKRQVINALLRADAGEHFVLVDLDSHLELSDSSNRKYFAEDQVHMIVPAYLIVAKHVATTVLGL
jgi:hypothetical protein